MRRYYLECLLGVWLFAWGAVALAEEAVMTMDHSQMHHDHAMTPVLPATTANLRDPHAYADGYGFGDLTHPKMGDEALVAALLVDRLEAQTVGNSAAMTYDAQAWVGKTFDRLVLRAEGRGDDHRIDDARSELLWGHALKPFWDSHLGWRHDSGMGPERDWLAMGVQGLAPYWFYVEATAYVGEQGRTAFRFESEYDLLLSQRLILQPRIEANFYSCRDNERMMDEGLADFEAGLRLRYEIRREFAPYIGVEWATKSGIKGLADSQDTKLVAGVRFWF